MTPADRIDAACAFVADHLAKELKKAQDAVQTADLDRAAARARIDRAIELGVEEPTWTGWSWDQGRREADEKLDRARDHLRTVELAHALAGAGMRGVADTVFPGGQVLPPAAPPDTESDP